MVTNWSLIGYELVTHGSLIVTNWLSILVSRSLSDHSLDTDQVKFDEEGLHTCLPNGYAHWLWYRQGWEVTSRWYYSLGGIVQRHWRRRNKQTNKNRTKQRQCHALQALSHNTAFTDLVWEPCLPIWDVTGTIWEAFHAVLDMSVVSCVSSFRRVHLFPNCLQL